MIGVITGSRQMCDLDELYTFVRETLVQRDMKISLRALDYAYEKHLGQTRKGSGLPYIVHPLWMARKALLLNDPMITDVTVAVILLHDVPEERPDTPVRSMPFESEVLDAVECLTILKDVNESVFARRVRGAEMIVRKKDSAIARAIDMLDILRTIPQDFEVGQIRKVILEDHVLKLPKLIEASRKWPDIKTLLDGLIDELKQIIYAYAKFYGVRLDDPDFDNPPEAEDYSYLLY